MLCYNSMLNQIFLSHFFVWQVRLEAVKTCSSLLTYTSSKSSHQSSQAQTVAEVLNRLLTVGITDSGKTSACVHSIKKMQTLKIKLLLLSILFWEIKIHAHLSSPVISGANNSSLDLCSLINLRDKINTCLEFWLINTRHMFMSYHCVSHTFFKNLVMDEVIKNFILFSYGFPHSLEEYQAVYKFSTSLDGDGYFMCPNSKCITCLL